MKQDFRGLAAGVAASAILLAVAVAAIFGLRDVDGRAIRIVWTAIDDLTLGLFTVALGVGTFVGFIAAWWLLHVTLYRALGGRT